MTALVIVLGAITVAVVILFTFGLPASTPPSSPDEPEQAADEDRAAG